VVEKQAEPELVQAHTTGGEDEDGRAAGGLWEWCGALLPKPGFALKLGFAP